MKMATPERHSWPYGQWNCYRPPHTLNLPKLPPPNQPHRNSQYNGNNIGIRCPEPLRPYQVPYPTYGSYCQQESHPVGPYFQPGSFYPPKPYVHRPIPHESFNNSYKVSENVHSYPTCSNNFSATKDQQSSCYQNSWNDTSQYQTKPPELDVRRFLATWQEKDDDCLENEQEVSVENEQIVYQGGYDSSSIPLDCTKRTSSDKTIKRNYDTFVNHQLPTPTGCVVQPYCIKDNRPPSNRNVLSSGEMNNNTPQRNNLNYGNEIPQSYHNKDFYSSSNYWKPNNEKYISCEHNGFSYPQHLNNCDINVNHLRDNISYTRQKDNLLDTERSQYNLTSSLESGDLFCDINSRNDDHIKQPVGHQNYSDPTVHKRLNCEQQPYFRHENNNFSENPVYTNLHPMKESWEHFPTSEKSKDRLKINERPKSVASKLSTHSAFEQSLTNNTPITGSVLYEGAFNILPNLNNHKPSVPVCNTVHYGNHIHLQPPSDSSALSSSVQSSTKVPPAASKCTQGNSKCKPYQYNDEISSDDIDISIASSGDLVIDEEPSAIARISVTHFSQARKEKLNDPVIEIPKEYNEIKSPNAYCAEPFTEKSPVVTSSSVLDTSNVDSVLKVADTTPKTIDDNSQKNSLDSSEECLKAVVMDLTVLKRQQLEENVGLNEKNNTDYLNLPINYFSQTDFEQDKKTNDFGDNIENHSSSLQGEKSSVIDHSLPLIDTSPHTLLSTNENDKTENLLSNTDNECSVLVSQKSSVDSVEPTSPFVGENAVNQTIPSERSTIIDENLDLKISIIHPSDNNKDQSLSSPLFTKESSPLFTKESSPSFTKESSPLFTKESSPLFAKESSPTFVKESSPLFNTPTTVNASHERGENIETSISFSTNDNLLLLAHCSQKYGNTNAEEDKKLEDLPDEKPTISSDSKKVAKPTRETVIKCSLRWDKIFNVMSDEEIQPDVSLDLGPAKVELRLPTENCSSGQWKIVEADNKAQTSSIVQVKRLILKRKSQSEERIPKMVIKKTDGQKYRSYLKKEPSESVLNCGKFKIYYDISSKSKPQKNAESEDPDHCQDEDSCAEED